MATPRLSPRGYGLLAMAAAMIASGVLVPSPAVSAGLLAAGLGAYAFTLAYGALVAVKQAAATRLRLVRRITGPRVEGEEHTVTLEACSPAPLPLEALEALDAAPATARPRGEPGALLSLPAGGCASLAYTVEPRMGLHRWGGVRLRLIDPLGLYEPLEAEAPAEGDERLEAAAAISEATLRASTAALAAVSASGSALARAGPGVSFLELRDYHEGDDPRLIDWKASARRGKLLVKVMEAEYAAPLVVALLIHPDAMRNLGAEAPGEAAARLAANTAAALARAGFRVKLVAAGPGGSRETPWHSGRDPRPLALEAALAARGPGPGAYLEELLERLRAAASSKPAPLGVVVAAAAPPGDVERLLAEAARLYRGRVAAAAAPPRGAEGEALEEWRLRWLPAAPGTVEALPGGLLGPRELEAILYKLVLGKPPYPPPAADTAAPGPRGSG